MLFREFAAMIAKEAAENPHTLDWDFDISALPFGNTDRDLTVGMYPNAECVTLYVSL